MRNAIVSLVAAFAVLSASLSHAGENDDAIKAVCQDMAAKIGLAPDEVDGFVAQCSYKRHGRKQSLGDPAVSHVKGKKGKKGAKSRLAKAEKGKSRHGEALAAERPGTLATSAPKGAKAGKDSALHAKASGKSAKGAHAKEAVGKKGAQASTHAVKADKAGKKGVHAKAGKPGTSAKPSASAKSSKSGKAAKAGEKTAKASATAGKIKK
jgi:hypothetical protein